ncbi:MFS transporter [Vibrio viridaestus]|uniref:MFS transporter n=1 Tax=Vibrio viridaestus TaxID=2487322 RepID=A0A3N9TG76_9VIBR|nr:MFS transporter [Vibrio viridaestus]RQW62753.1 MFS transporter [Vibrio viridaestus]
MKSADTSDNTPSHSLSTDGVMYRAILLCAFVFLAMNLRSPITSVPSVIDYIKSSLDIDSQVAGLLSSIPILCFGLLMPVMSPLVSKLGIDKSIIFTLAGIALGVIIRSFGGVTFLFLGTILMGASITMGNLVALMVISRDFKHKSDVITSIYVVAMSIGAMMTAGLTAPLAAKLGWQLSLALWSGLAFIAIALWLILFRIRTQPVELASVEEIHSSVNAKVVWKRSKVWLIALCFSAHTFMFYALTAWLPTYLIEVGGMTIEQAGTVASLFQIVSIIGCFLIPWLTGTARFTRAMLFMIVGSSWFIMIAGFIVLPAIWPLWIVFGGIGSGGGFLVVFMLVMDLSINIDENRKISSFVQGIGYIVASTGPTLIGTLHEYLHSWQFAFVLLAMLAIAMTAMGVTATRRKA